MARRVGGWFAIVDQATGFKGHDRCLWSALDCPVVKAVEQNWIFKDLWPDQYMSKEMPSFLYEAARYYFVFRSSAEAYFSKQDQEARKKKQEADAAKHRAPSFGVKQRR